LNVEGLLSLWVSPVPGCRGHRLTGGGSTHLFCVLIMLLTAQY